MSLRRPPNSLHSAHWLYSVEAVERINAVTVANIQALLSGAPTNVVKSR